MQRTLCVRRCIVYIFMCTHMHTHTHISTHACICISVYMYMCVHICECTVYIYLFVRGVLISVPKVTFWNRKKTLKWLFLVENQVYRGLPHPQNAPKHVLKSLLSQPVFSKVTRLHGKHRVKNTQLWLNEGTANHVRTGSLKEVLNAKIPHIWAPQGSRMANEVDWRSMDPYVGGKLWALWYGDSLPFLAA